MARPEEKAQAMLNKWVKMKEDESSDKLKPEHRRRRPFLASQCEHLHDAEFFRKQIIREISDGIRRIQNPGLGEHSIRDLNDEINKKMREKWHWNRRIAELGGRDYNKEERRRQREEGDAQSLGGLKGSGGYRYFGAAKDLPGVKELFARHAANLVKRKRGDIYKYITSDYYGLRDEEDGVLLELEQIAGSKRQKQMEDDVEEYRRKQKEKGGCSEDESSEDDESGGMGGITGAADAFAAHVAVPTQDIVAKTILEQKKKELLERLTL